MGYIIWDKEKGKYISVVDGGWFSVVDNIEKAFVWKNINKANNTISTINKNKNFKRHHLNLELKEVVRDSSTYDIEDCENVNIDLEDVTDMVKNIFDFTSTIEKRRVYLNQEIQTCSLEIADIEHAAEFYTLSASQGYKLYKMLHDVRCKRRTCKDELLIIEAVLESKLNSKELKNVENRIKGLDKRKYLPRVVNELFGV